MPVPRLLTTDHVVWQQRQLDQLVHTQPSLQSQTPSLESGRIARFYMPLDPSGGIQFAPTDSSEASLAATRLEYGTLPSLAQVKQQASEVKNPHYSPPPPSTIQSPPFAQLDTILNKWERDQAKLMEAKLAAAKERTGVEAVKVSKAPMLKVQNVAINASANVTTQCRDGFSGEVRPIPSSSGEAVVGEPEAEPEDLKAPIVELKSEMPTQEEDVRMAGTTKRKNSADEKYSTTSGSSITSATSSNSSRTSVGSANKKSKLQHTDEDEIETEDDDSNEDGENEDEEMEELKDSSAQNNFNQIKQQAQKNRRRVKIPLTSVDILTKWFKSHVAHPYPTDAEKFELMKEANVDDRQFINWFTNTRKRFWYKHPYDPSQNYLSPTRVTKTTKSTPGIQPMPKAVAVSNILNKMVNSGASILPAKEIKKKKPGKKKQVPTPAAVSHGDMEVDD